MNSSVGRELMKLLKTPVDAYNNVIKLLALGEYGSVLEALDYRGRTQICCYLINNMLDNDTQVQEEEYVEKVRIRPSFVLKLTATSNRIYSTLQYSIPSNRNYRYSTSSAHSSWTRKTSRESSTRTRTLMRR